MAVKAWAKFTREVAGYAKAIADRAEIRSRTCDILGCDNRAVRRVPTAGSSYYFLCEEHKDVLVG